MIFVFIKLIKLMFLYIPGGYNKIGGGITIKNLKFLKKVRDILGVIHYF